MRIIFTAPLVLKFIRYVTLVKSTIRIFKFINTILNKTNRKMSNRQNIREKKNSRFFCIKIKILLLLISRYLFNI